MYLLLIGVCVVGGALTVGTVAMSESTRRRTLARLLIAFGVGWGAAWMGLEPTTRAFDESGTEIHQVSSWSLMKMEKRPRIEAGFPFAWERGGLGKGSKHQGGLFVNALLISVAVGLVLLLIPRSTFRYFLPPLAVPAFFSLVAAFEVGAGWYACHVDHWNYIEERDQAHKVAIPR